MYQQLYQYFLLQKKLSLAGFGTFVLNRRPADIDIANRLVHPPTYAITLQHGGVSLSDELISYLASRLDISESEAASQLQQFLEQTKAELTGGSSVFWKGMGTLSKGLAGEVRFDPIIIESNAVAIPASRVLRENAAHTVRVGEDEKTSDEMREMLQPAAGKRSIWWALALILALAAFVFICYYLSEHGVSTASTGNQQVITPAAIPASTGE